MQAIIKDYKLEISGIEQAMVEIETYLSENNLYLNYLVIDGKEVLEDFESYIQAHAKANSLLEVIALTQDEFLRILKEELTKSATQLLQEISTLAYQFYSMLEEAVLVDKLVDLLEQSYKWKESAEWLITVNKPNYEGMEDLNRIHQILSLFTEAVENKDSIYIADLLIFELKTWLEQFQSAI